MLMLYLDDARRYDKPCKDRDGKLVWLSKETCEFVLAYAFHCMSDTEAELALSRLHKKPREGDLYG